MDKSRIAMAPDTQHTDCARCRAKSAGPCAKLTPPRITAILPRERLFRRLDELRTHSVFWLWGPPGFGKTALAASYLHARSAPGLWYRVDADDCDPANLFFHLGVGAARLSQSAGRPLPAFRPDGQREDLCRFSRHFFCALFSRLPDGTLVVLDDVAAAEQSPAFRDALLAGFGEIPDSVRVLVCSRSPPPERCARLQVQRILEEMGHQELRFTRQETQDLASSVTDVDPERVEFLYRRTEGWAAGITFLLDKQLRSESRDFSVDPKAGDELLFGYFAAEILTLLSSSVQTALARLAVMPEVTREVAVVITGDPGIAAQLDEMHRRGFFVRRCADRDRYEVHPLFREFLKARVPTGWSVNQRTRVLSEVARLVERDREFQLAAELYREAGAWSECIRLIGETADVLLRQGRSQTLEQLIGQLPSDLVDVQPWLMYWQALARLPVGPVISRGLLEKAYSLFRDSDDVPGRFLATAAILRTFYYERGNLIEADSWLRELDHLVGRHPDFVSPEIEAQVLAVGTVMVYRRPDHPQLELWQQRAVQLLRRGVGPHEQSGITDFVLCIHCWRGDVTAADDVLRELDRLLGGTAGSPLILLALNVWGSLVSCLNGDTDVACARLDRAAEIMREQGLGHYELPVLCNRAYPLLSAGKLDEADSVLREIETHLPTGRIIDLCFYHHLRSLTALLRNRPAAAKYDSEVVLDLSEESGVPFHAALQRTVLIPTLITLREYDRAKQELERLKAFAEAMPAQLLRFDALLGEAELLLERGDDEGAAVERLAVALAHGAARNYMSTSAVWIPSRMSRLFALALERHIEPEYVTRVIRKRCLPAPHPAVANWPWPVRIHTLGRFALKVEDQAQRSSGKPQRRTLDLLKAIIGFGAAEVSIDKLTDALWPDADGASARSALDMAVHRLRKLLGRDDALTVRDGKVSLNSGCCWLDVRALDWYLNEAEALVKANASEGELGRILARLLQVYPGDFLANEADAPWILPMRDRLRNRFLRQVMAIGRCFEAMGRWRNAIELYERALELNPCAEALYRRLMHCHRALGHPAAGLMVYGRCREILARELNILPSKDTQALFESISRQSVRYPLDNEA